MRDVKLIAFTMQAIRDLGNGGASVAGDGLQARAWHAGPQPLNGQAMQDLIEDGWLRRSLDGRALLIDAWPTFADPQEDRRHG